MKNNPVLGVVLVGALWFIFFAVSRYILWGEDDEIAAQKLLGWIPIREEIFYYLFEYLKNFPDYMERGNLIGFMEYHKANYEDAIDTGRTRLNFWDYLISKGLRRYSVPCFYKIKGNRIFLQFRGNEIREKMIWNGHWNQSVDYSAGKIYFFSSASIVPREDCDRKVCPYWECLKKGF